MKSRSFNLSRELGRIPPFPPVALRLLALLAKPSVDIKEVAELVNADPTFATRLLQCVNSYEFGLRHEVSNICQAINLVGLERTRQITVTLAAGIYAQGAPRTQELRRCWRHSVATAVLAGEIARSCGAFMDVAFTAGIVHDVGRIGLLAAFPREYESVVRGAAARCVDLLDFEREEFGANHAEVGQMLAERWGLPNDFLVIAGRHHDPCEGSELDLLRIVHVACRWADALGYEMVLPLTPLSVEEVLAELPEAARRLLPASKDQLCAQIEKRIGEFDSGNAVEVGAEPDPGTLSIVSGTQLEVITQLKEITPFGDPPPVKRRGHIRALVVAGVIAALVIVALVLLRRI